MLRKHHLRETKMQFYNLPQIKNELFGEITFQMCNSRFFFFFFLFFVLFFSFAFHISFPFGVLGEFGFEIEAFMLLFDVWYLG